VRFCALDCGDAGHASTSPFFAPPSRTRANVAGQHADAAGRHGDAGSDGLGADVDHVRLSSRVKWVNLLMSLPVTFAPRRPPDWMGTNQRHVYHTNAPFDLLRRRQAARRTVNRSLLRAVALTVATTLTMPPLAVAPARAQSNELPSLGEAGGDDLSPANERKLGESIMARW